MLTIACFGCHWMNFLKLRSFKYLGAIVSNEGSKPEVLSRMAQTTAAATKLKVI